MLALDLQTRKLNLIEYLIGLQDEIVFNKIESNVFESGLLFANNLKPFSINEMIERAKIADADYFAGRFLTQADLEKESENW